MKINKEGEVVENKDLIKELNAQDRKQSSQK